ncbi:restriction endonuclease [Nitratireductor arenosus]|nr:restriction endonuclease [Nitratireductor arenosus]
MEDMLEDWKRYERLVARLLADQLSTGFCVPPNASVLGGITGIKRQIDVLIEARHDTDNSRRIIVDAKRRKRKIDVKDVESFRGMMEDVGATHGYLVCPHGHTAAAEKRAQRAAAIRLLPLDRLEDFDPRTWPRCSRPGCKNGRVFWDGYPEVSLGFVAPDGTPKRLAFVHSVGKCDQCRVFHASCATCHQILCVPRTTKPT